MTHEFLEAVKKGDFEKVKALLKADPSLGKAEDDNGITPVILASYYGHRDLSDFLATHRADLSIFEAATTGRTGRVLELIRKEPKLINAFSSDGFTALHLASFFGHSEITKILLEHKANVNAVAQNSRKVMPLHSALARNDLPIVELLVAHGADVNAVQEAGFTPLHAAAQNGNIQAAILLLSHGAKINARADNGKTPLALTMVESGEAGSKEDRERVAEFLRDHGAQ